MMPVRILIIEDHVDNLELMSYLLKAFGYRTLAAGDGLAGMALAASQRPDLIICDIQLPGIDGYEVARRLSGDAELCKIPLIGVTALAMVGDRERVLAAGFDGYIAKPISPETFVGEVEVFLEMEQRAAAANALPSGNGLAESADAAEKPRAPSRGIILVVDDIEPNRELALSIFEPSGYTVLLAADITSAMKLAADTPPDLILSDVNLLRSTGVELLMQVKADPRLKAIPVVLISSSVPSEMSGTQFLAVGAATFLRRPIDPYLLLKEIEGIMGASRR
jgi:two-component system cell cycle response regulator